MILVPTQTVTLRMTRPQTGDYYYVTATIGVVARVVLTLSLNT